MHRNLVKINVGGNYTNADLVESSTSSEINEIKQKKPYIPVKLPEPEYQPEPEPEPEP